MPAIYKGFYMPKVSELAALYPNDCEALQSLRAECAHHTYFMNSGYINYYIDDNFKPFEHRLMAELLHGEIPAGYQVHHINRVRSDNRACNLEIIDPSKHAHVHHGVAILHVVSCAVCGREIEIKSARLNRNEQFFCNRSCYMSAVRKEPDPQTLQRLLDTIRNLSEIGRIYDVSHTTVRKWVKKHSLNAAICNGRKYKVARASIDLAPAP